jgi:hypothetical protein
MPPGGACEQDRRTVRREASVAAGVGTRTGTDNDET